MNFSSNKKANLWACKIPLHSIRTTIKKVSPTLKYIPVAGSTAAFIFLIFLLFLNASHGFDITDESFYLLWARQPDRVLASVTQFGFFTSPLYILSGKNVAIFRILGIILLLGASLLFACSLDKYWLGYTGKISLRAQRHTLIPILNSVLAYYGYWLLTPSYNWLALLSVLLCGAGLLDVTAKRPADNKQITYLRLLLNGLLVGVGGGIAFMAKPTTAIMLAAVTLYWLLIHPRCRYRFFFIIIALLTACFILLFQAVVLQGGLSHYYSQLTTAIDVTKTLGAGHSLPQAFDHVFISIKSLPSRIASVASHWILLTPLFLFAAPRDKKKQESLVINRLFFWALPLFFLITCYRLWHIGQYSSKGLGFYGISLLLVTMSFAILMGFVLKKGNHADMPVFRLLTLCFFLIVLTGAYAFGSANDFIYQMSGALVFLVAALLYVAVWISHTFKNDFFVNIVSLTSVFAVSFVIVSGFNHPYRLPTKINAQNIRVTLLGSNGFLYVDRITAKYINELKSIALREGWKPGTTLIDLTGATPGAAVILNGKFVGFPWLVGGYPGSELFAKRMIEMAPKAEQRSAWILTAPTGIRKNIQNVLLELGLNFPGNYKAVGKMKTGHRRETQILWKPIKFNPEKE